MRAEKKVGVLAHLARARHWQCRGERFESAILHNLHWGECNNNINSGTIKAYDKFLISISPDYHMCISDNFIDSAKDDSVFCNYLVSLNNKAITMPNRFQPNKEDKTQLSSFLPLVRSQGGLWRAVFTLPMSAANMTNIPISYTDYGENTTLLLPTQ